MATTTSDDDEDDDDPVRVISKLAGLGLFGIGCRLYGYMVNMGNYGSGLAVVDW